MIGGMRDPAWHGGWVGQVAHCVLAPNPSHMTLDGTNTWVVGAAEADEVIVVDPGPLDEAHLQAVLDHVAARGARVATTLLTHGHHDHAESAGRFAELTGAPVRAVAAGDLGEGDVVRAAGVELVVVGTPGHTGDSLSFLLPEYAMLLTGDTVLGRGTAVIYHPDGVLGDYLESLERLAKLAANGDFTTLLPGHGPAMPDAGGVLRAYLEHRHARLDEVRAAIARGAREIESIVATVYAQVPRGLWPAARRSVAAQLAYLRQRGELADEPKG